MSDNEGPIRSVSSDSSCTSATTDCTSAMTESFDRESVTGDPPSFDHLPELAPSNNPPQPLPQEQSPPQDQSAAQLRGAYARLPSSPEPIFPGQEEQSGAQQKGAYVRLTRPSNEVFPGPKTSPGPKEARVRHSPRLLGKNPKKRVPTINEEKEARLRLLESSSSDESSEILPPQQILKATSGKGKSRSFSLPSQKKKKKKYHPNTKVRQVTPSKTPERRRKSEGQTGRLKKKSSLDSPKKKSPLKKIRDTILKPFGFKKDAKGKKGTKNQSRSKKEHGSKVDDPGFAEASTSAAGPSGIQALEKESEYTDENPNVIPQRMRRQRSDSESDECDSSSKRKALDE